MSQFKGAERQNKLRTEMCHPGFNNLVFEQSNFSGMVVVKSYYVLEEYISCEKVKRAGRNLLL